MSADIEGFRIDGGRRGGVLLVHGFTGSPYEMRGLGEALAESGYTAIGPRLPGHGRPAEDEDNSNAAWRAAIDDGLREASAVVPGRPITLIGLSMGALLALDAARRFPSQVRAVVALSAAIRLPRRLTGMLWIAGRLATPSVRARLVPKGVSDIQDPEARSAHPVSNPFPLSAILSFDELRREVRRNLRSIRQPVLIVHGRKDRTCPIAGADWLSRRVGSTEVEMHVLERSGHVLTVDHERTEATRLILDFLERRA